ncbi:MAG TPA: sugar ABC transporter permease [Spirochaetota bacterium]|nr:MAG: Maltose transport system permease protein MalG [Spirochaetes bacterium ADurb.Bin133]HNZ28023.1 sugar ABC transporter permease [Spirochaetota bacterium]HOF00983.1 sugar ABC transporter permease [Spirochaetota bacterium]HOS32480.1 sugar ABC transporter permease [Spirochaetota bacterium]HOS54817.1 sugar ABC transporter permease [Spirochaetota bacterium]
MRKSRKTASDYIKEVLQHIILLFVALIVLTPILYLVSAGFRTNQAIFGPFIDTNSWVDDEIADKTANKIKKDVLFNRIIMILDGKTSDEISLIEDSREKIKPNMSGKLPELQDLKIKVKNWIYSNASGKTREAFIESYKKWSEKIPVELKEQVEFQLFKDSSTLEPRYKYEIRTSLYNFKCFFTGEVPNAKNARFPYLKWLINSLVIAGSVALVQVVVTALASYALSRFRFKGKKAGLMVILTVQVFPGTMAMVALYLLLQYLGNVVPALGIDRKLGLILIYLGGGIPFNIWLVKGYFDTIPKALEESAMIDGATYWQAFTMIILPLVRPILAVITVLSFVGQYNEFVLAMVILTSQENFTLPVGLRFFTSGQQDARFGVFAACSIMGSLPIVILWLSLQNQIISGLTGGSVKG